ncbi:MAG: hypothetical protein ACRYGI_07365 [Janthinobacterium lividum]
MVEIFRIGTLGAVLTLATLAGREAAVAQQAAQPSAPAAASATGASANSQENLTVLGRRRKFETAPMPGPEMPPPPDKPATHLGRYKISGDQEKHDGYDAQTGANIGQFGTAYTGASPVSQGLASRFQH